MDAQMTIELSGDKRVTAHYDGFTIATDQSVKNGGGASAPEPFDLFLASIGTCAGYYVSVFCQGRGIPTQGVRLVQSWTRDDQRRLALIELEIHLPPGFPEKYHRAVLRAANLCSVKRVLESPPVVESRIVAAS